MNNFKMITIKNLIVFINIFFFIPIILVTYFFIFVPLALIFRLLKIDILNLKFNNKNTYWIKKSSSKINMKSQF